MVFIAVSAFLHLQLSNWVVFLLYSIPLVLFSTEFWQWWFLFWFIFGVLLLFKPLICSLFQKDIFTVDDVYRTVDWQLFLLSPLKISFHCLLASVVSVENLSHVILARLLDFQDFQFSAEFLQVVFISLNLLRIAVLSLFWIIPIFGSPV